MHDSEARCFYLLCNKYQQKLGLFLIKLSEDDPTQYNFFMKWKNKLDISDADIGLVHMEEQYRELVVSYKTIFMNTYNVLVVDISQPNHQWLQFRHESFQLWETHVAGFLLQKNNDYVTVNRDGISVFGLGSYDKRAITSDKKQELMLHCLDSTSYLKVDVKNYILFEFANVNNRTISIMQQFTKESAS